MGELLFKVDDHVRLRKDFPKFSVVNKKSMKVNYYDLAGHRGRVVQVNVNNFDGKHYGVRVSGCKRTLWFSGLDLEKVSPLDRLAEIQ